MLEFSPRGAHRRYDLVRESHSMAGIVMIRVLMKLRAELDRREPLRAVWARDAFSWSPECSDRTDRAEALDRV